MSNGDRVVMASKFYGTIVGVGVGDNKNIVWVQFDKEPKEWRVVSKNSLEVVK